MLDIYNYFPAIEPEGISHVTERLQEFNFVRKGRGRYSLICSIPFCVPGRPGRFFFGRTFDFSLVPRHHPKKGSGHETIST